MSANTNFYSVREVGCPIEDGSYEFCLAPHGNIVKGVIRNYQVLFEKARFFVDAEHTLGPNDGWRKLPNM